MVRYQRQSKCFSANKYIIFYQHLMCLPSNYTQRLLNYNALLRTLNPSKLFMECNAGYFNFMIIGGEDFDSFDPPSLLNIDKEKLRDEYNMVKDNFEKLTLPVETHRDIGVGTEDEEKHVLAEELSTNEANPELSTDEANCELSHGMKISSAFNGIDKEAQKKKAEEIMARSAATMQSRFIQNRKNDGYGLPEGYFYEDDEEESVDRLLDPDYEVIYQFDSPIKEMKDRNNHYIFELIEADGYSLDNHKNDNQYYNTIEDQCYNTNEDSENTINSDDTPLVQNPELYVGDEIPNCNLSRQQIFQYDRPRWNIKRTNYIYNRNFGLILNYCEGFIEWLHSKNCILYEMINANIYEYDFSTSRTLESYNEIPSFADDNSNDNSDDSSNNDSNNDNTSHILDNLPKNLTDSISKETLNELISNIAKQMNRKEELSETSFERKPSQTSFESEISDYDNYAKDFEGVELFARYDLIELLIPIELYSDDPNIMKYTKMVINLYKLLFDYSAVENMSHKLKVIKDYISYKLGTDKFFNFEITKDSSIYIKYRKMGFRVPLKRSYTFNSNDMAKWNLIKYNRLEGPTKKELTLLEENPLFSIYAFLYALSREKQYISIIHGYISCSPSQKAYLNIINYKYAIETLKIWKKYNVSLMFRVYDNNLSYAQEKELYESGQRKKFITEF